MANRIALVAASAAATATLVVAAVAAGFGPSPAASTGTDPIAVDPAAADPQAAPSVQIDTIYVAPPPEPATITLQQGPSGGEDGEGTGEHESGDDD